MYQVTAVTGATGGECYLIVSEKSALLYDSGFGFSGAAAAENIAQVLGGRSLDYILLSHSHYDHAMGSTAIKRRHPGAKVVASGYAAKIFAKESAHKLMRSLDEGAAGDAGWDPGPDLSAELAADLPMEDGDILTLPDMTIQAVATPGHTKCSMSFFFREEGLLCASETSGVTFTYDEVFPVFIVGYRMTLESIDRLEALRPKHIMISHTGLLPDERAAKFFPAARAAAQEAATFVAKMHRQGAGVDEIVDAYHNAFFNERLAVYQPERAFRINAEAMVPKLIKELLEDDTLVPA